MKQLFCLSICLLLSIEVGHAAPHSDIPAKHWASGAVKRLTAQKILVPSGDGKYHGDKPVTRYELAVTLDRLVQYLEAGRKPLTVTAPKATAVLPPHADAATRQALRHLSASGFIDVHSPLLLVNKAITAQELTDALAHVTVTLTERSLPHAK